MVNASHFEAKKHAYRQTQDGIVVSFTIHPEDVDAAFATAPLGTRYMVAFAEIGDDEKPIEQLPPVKARETAPDAGAAPKVGHSKPKRSWSELSPTEQAAIRCTEPMFQAFVGMTDPEGAAKQVRTLCGVESRKALSSDPGAAAKWRDLETRYQQKLTDLNYGDARRD